MSMAEMAGEPVDGESGREEGGRPQEPASPRRATVRRWAVRAAVELAVEAGQMAVDAWAPQWSGAAWALGKAVRLAVHRRKRRDRRPRG
ncbi:hypothetical protein GCM10010260_81860 [Streptomyces filipinensis]|uniref:Uncharacterized protein n=1 Tax=Streptomyces filipinensis TaxID=66887 RepID=A0A918MG90_9ACTN|nr:hypothetical protein [Streptomyces filipinensis]GGV29014.1 hypothetical protein GCM10010260_81860 [Streptomyces filipinensis]